ncbi:MAG: amidase [Pirellulales bacterium]|nr:amidase [Pirellulales bacterium]
MDKPLTITEASRRIRDGRLAPLELVETCLEQIDRFDDQVHAWVTVDEQQARRTAEMLGRQTPRGPLHGIPLGIKDIADVEGLPTRAGSPLREDHVARQDAPLVAALRRAGAILLGKTVTVEFACFDPSPTLNPWDPQWRHTPGGSSSGSAVAVALGMCPAAIGTQTGGSLVRPATYCGVATCKPTFGRIDTGGIVPVSYHLDHPGPMARTVDDLEILLRCLVASGGAAEGPPPKPQPGGRRDESADSSRPAAPRLGLLEQFFMEEVDQPVREVTLSALARLREAGAKLEPLAFPDGFEQVQPMHRTIMAVEAAEYHRRQFADHRDSYGPLISSLLDEGLTISAVQYAAALAWQRRFRRRVATLFEEVDALIMPSTDTTAPASLETTGTPKFQAPWSCAGVPVVSLPSGVASDGMPAAVQLVGPAGDDWRLLQVARWCERWLAFDALPPLMA